MTCSWISRSKFQKPELTVADTTALAAPESGPRAAADPLERGRVPKVSEPSPVASWQHPLGLRHKSQERLRRRPFAARPLLGQYVYSAWLAEREIIRETKTPGSGDAAIRRDAVAVMGKSGPQLRLAPARVPIRRLPGPQIAAPPESTRPRPPNPTTGALNWPPIRAPESRPQSIRPRHSGFAPPSLIC